MERSRKNQLYLWIGGGVILAASAGLIGAALPVIRSLEKQAALVFESAASREARARLPELERALRAAEAPALRALLDLPAEPGEVEILRAVREHPLIRAPFLLAAGGAVSYPAPSGLPLAALAEDDPPPEVYLRACRLAASPGKEEEAAAALEAVAAAPELAGVWRLRARIAVAGLRLRTGRAGEAAEIYASIQSDFAEELDSHVQPARAAILAGRIVALDRCGKGREAEGLLLAALRGLGAPPGIDHPGEPGAVRPGDPSFLRQGAVGVDDASVLLERARRLARSAPEGELARALEPIALAHARRVRAERLGRAVREWILPRASAPGSDPERTALVLGGEECLVSWTRGREGSGLLAAGFWMEEAPARAALASALETPESGAGQRLPLRFASIPPSGSLHEGFHELASLPAPLQNYRIGLERADWERLTGAARWPFRASALLIVALSFFLTLAALLTVLLLRREILLSRLKTEFVANVSHELKTPLALIRLFGETLLLDRVRDPAKARGYHEIIVRESERLTHLVNNVLDFASIEAGRKKFDFRPCDLSQVVEETVAGYRLQLEEKGMRVTVEAAAGAPAVLADRDAVAQALINLLDNALKYAAGGGEVAVRTSIADGALRIATVDRGPGIAPGEERRIFETFYRSPRVRGTGARGSGLGLSLVAHILRAHGGKVVIEATPGGGATFILIFPLSAADSRGAPGERKGPAAPPPPAPVSGVEGEERTIGR